MAPTLAAPAFDAEPALPEPADCCQHLVFRVGEVSAALPLQDIREVVRRPDVLAVPLSPPAIEGLVNLRGTVTVLINMRRVLGLPAAAADEAARIIVLGGTARVGLQVDRIAGMIDIAPERIERPNEAGFYSGTMPGGGDQPAISLLDLDRVLRRVAAGIARPVQAVSKKGAAAVVQAASVAAADTRTLVSFEADGEEYAVPVSAVREIVRRQEKIARMPHADGHMLGVINLRKRLLPLVELRTLLGLATVDRRDDTAGRIIVLSFGGLEVGLLVDRAREILRVPNDQIDPVPVLFRQDSGEIEAICRLDQGRRLISILDPDRLFRSEVVRRTLISQEKGMADSPAVMQSSSETFVIFRLGDGRVRPAVLLCRAGGGGTGTAYGDPQGSRLDRRRHQPPGHGPSGDRSAAAVRHDGDRPQPAHHRGGVGYGPRRPDGRCRDRRAEDTGRGSRAGS